MISCGNTRFSLVILINALASRYHSLLSDINSDQIMLFIRNSRFAIFACVDYIFLHSGNLPKWLFQFAVCNCLNFFSFRDFKLL